jgi:hypothetical protein
MVFIFDGGWNLWVTEVRIDLRAVQITVPQKLLDLFQLHAALQ